MTTMAKPSLIKDMNKKKKKNETKQERTNVRRTQRCSDARTDGNLWWLKLCVLFVTHFKFFLFFSHQFMIFDHLKINRRELLWSNSLICKFMICRILKWIFNKTKKDERPSQEEQFFDFYTSFWTFTVSYLFFLSFSLSLRYLRNRDMVSRSFVLFRVNLDCDGFRILSIVPSIWESKRFEHQLSARTIWRSPYHEIRISVQRKLWRSILSSYFLSFFFFFWYNFSGELLNLLLLSFVEIRSD